MNMLYIVFFIDKFTVLLSWCAVVVLWFEAYPGPSKQDQRLSPVFFMKTCYWCYSVLDGWGTVWEIYFSIY